ncbi:uncharacterized protein LOC108481522 [Gossypium arboreum]|uniref:uncharacterized protein LOC108481522 n=1 Tax=Gossypium arboreum TaxID=29729 RepID=UPI0008192216|nr:uncharacterized protein LOC108481522 [Gossypium arboreum]
MSTRLNLFDDGSLLAELQVKPTWIELIKGKQMKDKSLGFRFRQIESGETSDFGVNSEGTPRNKFQTSIEENERFQNNRDAKLKRIPGLKQEVTDFVGKCLTCQQVKAERQLPSSLLQPVKILL